MRWKPLLTLLIVPVLLFVGVAWATTTPQSALPRLAGADRALTVVTLLTGDRVTLLDSSFENVSVEPGAGRAGVTFLTRRTAGHLRVIPSDAVALLRDGRLDARLFDVAQLLRSGHAGPAAPLPLIMTYPDTGGRIVGRSAVAATGATPGQDLPALGGFAVKVAKGDLGAFWSGLKGVGTSRSLAAGGPKVWLDGMRQPTLDVSVPMIGGPEARRAGLDGRGVQVAVLDTGIDATHPDLAGRVAAAQNFTDGVEDDRDLVGHGTHVASTIAGDGAASDGRYTGVAPGAELLDGKVCVVDGCAESWILAGMQWAADQGAEVVNMSLGGDDTPEVDPLEQAVQTLTAQHGMLFVIAAGNRGRDGSVDSPASADAALAVGAVTKSDQLADFSSRGPRIGDRAIKPDLTAPGADITAARGKDAEFGEAGQSYVTLSGTSMATPHVSGAAAALKQQHPKWSPEQLKAALMGSTSANPSLGVFAQGAGRLDLARAITQSVFATPASLSFGEQRWPHGDDQPITSTVGYANHGAHDVTLSLAVTTAAPAGMFTLSEDSLTVPAGGQAAVTVTADTRVGTADGAFTGYLVATGDGVAVRSPLAVHREVESYDLTLTHTGRDGAPSTTHFTEVMRVSPEIRFEDFRSTYGPDSTVTVRLPKGSYVVDSVVADPDSATLLVQPRLELNAPRRVTLDARLGRPISVTVPDRSAISVLAEVTVIEPIADGLTRANSLLSSSFAGMYTARIGPDTRTVSTAVNGRWALPGPDGTLTDSPETYLLTWVKGRMVTGFERRVTGGDLATVHADYASQAPGVTSSNEARAATPNGHGPIWGYGIPFHAPFTRTLHYTTEDGLGWRETFMEGAGLTVTVTAPTVYRPGREYTQRWNRGVFGPAFGQASREADSVRVDMRLHSDGAGRPGDSLTARERVTLTRDGADLPGTEEGLGMRFAVPPQEGTYRLQIESDRDAPATLSTHITAAWTFRSAHTATRTALPLSAIRFSPRLDPLNTAPAGGSYAVPVTVTPQPGSTAAAPSTLTVEVSHDDGVTWEPAAVDRAGGRPIATVRHPDRDGFVSLRATATDANGTKVEQTIIRAYRIAVRPAGA
ncbi:S8 family serine peptidase [Phytohabitans rumicis]|uniref:Serine protease n=1 Tax=Phytohabitans rumicis TaxID=1076125 RepID=A0A6V8LB90_9ACTN|nr:S8 family serine peptidase [Phytohabitans rumicis]GFJ93624.1 serine protease [Phytohabitans rumicis]